MRRLFEQFNFKKTAQDLGVSVWQTPNFLFLLMGIIIYATIIVVFYMTKDYSDPRVLIASECLVVMVMLSTGSSIINRISDIARLNKLKTRFIEIASSRLKDPLSTIHWELEVLMERSGGELNPKQKESINSIVETNENMITLVKDLLNIVRIEDKSRIEGKDIISLDKVLLSIIHEQKEYAGSKKIKVNYKNEASDMYVKGDRGLVKIAIENIISNALTFSPREEEVDIKVSSKNNCILVKVKDNGFGIPDSEKSYIFTKFFRASNILSHNINGTGLGLYVTKKIIEGLRGKVWFKSEENKGTEFFMKFPIFFSNEK
jgi:signal transduction histidine kinase